MTWPQWAGNRLLAAAVAVAAVTLSLVLWYLAVRDDPDELRLSHFQGFASNLSQDEVPAMRPIAIQTFNLCTTGAPIRIRSVVLNDARGMRMVDWGERVYLGGIAGQPGTARSLGFVRKPSTPDAHPGRPATCWS